MRKVFEVELASRAHLYTELTLPAAPYAMLDALEKLRLEEGEYPDWAVISPFGNERLLQHLDLGVTLPELNVLAQQVSLLNERQLTIFEGLAKMEYERDTKPIPMPRLIDMAHSTDRCHFVEGVTTDAHLGRFCAENSIVPEADDLSDEAFELLDFARIGREFRQNEGGVFTGLGYVQRHDELRQVSKDMDFMPVKPDYAILVQTASGSEVKLPLPLGKTVVDEPVLCLDCAAPALTGMSGTIGTWDMLAHQLTYLTVNGGLPKYKAVLDATGCGEVDRALDMANELDQYMLEPNCRTPEEVAKSAIHFAMPQREIAPLLPHVNLYQYGQALIQTGGGKLTEYGLIERCDGQPVQTIEQKPAAGGMEMM